MPGEATRRSAAADRAVAREGAEHRFVPAAGMRLNVAEAGAGEPVAAAAWLAGAFLLLPP
jgi:hypothetical protein